MMRGDVVTWCDALDCSQFQIFRVFFEVFLRVWEAAIVVSYEDQILEESVCELLVAGVYGPGPMCRAAQKNYTPWCPPLGTK